MSSEPLLTAEGVVKIFGGMHALDGAHLTLNAGEILGLVGPNGSGKTTFINVISGVYKPDAGHVTFNQHNIAGHPPHQLARLGINRTYQVPKPFKDMSVRDNVLVAATFGGRGHTDPDSVLESTGLLDLAERTADTLNTSQQKRLDLARALATDPKVLLVDEIGAGQNPEELEETANYLVQLRDRGIALLVVEHLLNFLDRITSRVIVLGTGRNLFEGSLKDAVNDKRVVDAFIGG